MNQKSKTNFYFLIGRYLIFLLFLIYFFFFKKENSLNKKKIELFKKELIKNNLIKTQELKKIKEKEVIIENNVLKLSLSTIGGNIKNLFLKKNPNISIETDNFSLIKENSSLFGLEFTNKFGKKIDTYKLEFIPEIKEDIFKYTINMHAQLEPNVYIDYVYVVYKGNNYYIDFFIKSKGLYEYVSTNSFNLEWSQKILNLEKEKTIEKKYTNISFRINSKKNKINFFDKKKSSFKELDNLYWIANKQQFFASILCFKNQLTIDNSKKILIYSENINSDSELKFSELKIPFLLKKEEELNCDYKWYFGPLDYHILKKSKDGFEQIIPFGKGIAKVLNRYFFLNLFELFEKANINYGIIIILMTIVVKLLLSPITYSQYKFNLFMQKMQTKFFLNPQILIEFYKKIGINPIYSLLGNMIKIPIFYSLMNFFPTLINLRGKRFLWAKNLSYSDRILNFNFNIPIYGNHISLFNIFNILILFVLRIRNKFYKTYILFYIMMLFFFNNYPSGIYIYYISSNIINILFRIFYSRIDFYFKEFKIPII
ncbi:YidC/Oxa1 family insertase periplasmic-domain containing protein [Candidatus Karelsulcia muelleri]|uniref:YidC/Oxa1 family insertase periplasmic-domain containing protein n=1 Tax=Candidatus Karelsulcia muelleri TaxID=336810 RepID=UPI000D7C536E|nr:YidC/Oxa1 family insertase periplasmic-domain containing protein [Candidatus Karelsulcia muelleri]